jgi:hypothetical protein
MGERGPEPPRAARIVGYLIAAAINAALLWCAYRILDWGWLPFLTEEWRDVLPMLALSLGATVVANLGFVAYDGPALKSLVNIVLLALSIAASVTMWRVFPFDFTPYAFGWGTLARVLLVVAIAGAAIGIVAELVKLVRAVSRPQPAA